MNKFIINIAVWFLDRIYNYVDKNDDGKLSKKELEDVYKDLKERINKIKAKL